MCSAEGDHRASVASDVTVKPSPKLQLVEQDDGFRPSMHLALRKRNALSERVVGERQHYLRGFTLIGCENGGQTGVAARLC